MDAAKNGTARGPSDNQVQITRSWAGFLVVLIGDVAIAGAAIAGLVAMSRTSDAAATMIISILSTAFTAIATMTTAYFGIRAASNTAQASHMRPEDGTGGGGGGEVPRRP